MKEEIKKLLIITIGIFLLLYSIISISYALFFKTPSSIFWACYITMLIAGIGVLTRNSYLIAAMIDIILPYMLVWDIDFLYELIFNKKLLGITSYVFSSPSFQQIISLTHLLLIPSILLPIYLIGLKRKDHWKISIIGILVITTITLLLTNPSSNINCVFKPCISSIPLIQYYFPIWVGILIIMAIITSFILNKIFIKK